MLCGEQFVYALFSKADRLLLFPLCLVSFVLPLLLQCRMKVTHIQVPVKSQFANIEVPEKQKRRTILRRNMRKQKQILATEKVQETQKRQQDVACSFLSRVNEDPKCSHSKQP